MIEKKKWKNWVLGSIGAIVAGSAIMLGAVVVGNTAITQLVGLAVAQTSTLWNNVIDAAKGDAQTSGILGMGLYLYNGATFDRARGDTTNGLDVDVTRISGSITPADSYANPTTANQVWSLNGIFNGTTWDRQQSANSDTQTLGIPAAGLLGYNSVGNNWVRLRALGGQLEPLIAQSRTGTVTTQSVSGANAAVAITIPGIAGTFAHLNGIDAYCSAGTSGITVTRTTGPTTIWSTPATGVGTTLFSKEFPVALTATVTGDTITVTLATCGVGNTGTLMVRGGLGL